MLSTGQAQFFFYRIACISSCRTHTNAVSGWAYNGHRPPLLHALSSLVVCGQVAILTLLANCHVLLNTVTCFPATLSSLPSTLPRVPDTLPPDSGYAVACSRVYPHVVPDTKSIATLIDPRQLPHTLLALRRTLRYPHSYPQSIQHPGGR